MKQIYGIDLSKDKFDVNFILPSGSNQNKTIKNKLPSIVAFLNSIDKDSILCMEHTGVYGELLAFTALTFNFKVSLVSGYEIKHSLGALKGKSDTIDACRIRQYAERFSDKLKFAHLESETLHELRELHVLRTQLVKERKMLLTNQQSKKHCAYNSSIAHKIAQEQLNSLNKAIEDIELEIMVIIYQMPKLFENFQLLNFIFGIGPVTSCELIIKTDNFEKINTARKAASFAGICPFPNESGTMVKKSKTSPMADKALKTLLYLCASTAVQNNKEYALYYQRKALEGKPHHLIMNNVSHKLLRTVYSIIKSRKPYSPEYFCIDPRKRLKKVA
jgi:transposase